MNAPIRPLYSGMMASVSDGSMRAHVDVDAGILMSLPAEAPLLSWDPQNCPTAWLPICAYNYSVFYTEEIWSEQTLRNWIEGNWSFIRSIGTMPAFQTALSPSGYTVVEVVRPPQAFYASPSLSKQELDEWYELMPSIRITFAERTGQDNGQWFVGESFVESDTGFAGLDMGPQLYGRFGVLRQDGVDIPLQNISDTISVEEKSATDFERMSVPGLSSLGFFSDESAARDNRFVGAGEKAAYVLTMRIDASYDDVTADVSLNTLVPSLEPIDVRHRIISDIGSADCGIFAGDAIEHLDFVGQDRAARMLADVVFLLDPSISVPMSYGASFANVDRVGMELRTAELMIDLHTSAEVAADYAGLSFAGATFAVPADTSHVDRAIRAVEAARGLLDQIRVRFDTKRPLQAGDTVPEGTILGEWVKNSL